VEFEVLVTLDINAGCLQHSAVKLMIVTLL